MIGGTQKFSKIKMCQDGSGLAISTFVFSREIRKSQEQSRIFDPGVEENQDIPLFRCTLFQVKEW